MKEQRLSVPDELYARTKVSLLYMITENAKKKVDRLPPEDTLAKQLGVSRVLIRDIFGELESRGYIARKRGKGTMINIPVCQAGPRIDEQISFLDVIEIKGMQPSVQLLDDHWVGASEAELAPDAEILHSQGPLLHLERTFCGNGKPLIHSKVYFRGDNFLFDYKKWKGYGELSLSEYLEVFCEHQATVTLAELDLYLADEEMSTKLEVVKGAPLFRMTDIRFDFDGHEIVRGRAIFCPEVLPLKMVRHGE